MGFHPEERTHLDATEPDRQQKLDRVRAGTAHAALVFESDRCVGWCQFGPPDEVPRIKSRREYEKGLARLPDWRIACCYVGKGHRRQGVAGAALAGALDLIAAHGGGRSKGIPSRLALCRPDSSSTALSRRTNRPDSKGPQDRQAPLGRHQAGSRQF
jgi:hypothetical protein